MDVVEYTPTREQFAYTFGGAAPAMRIKPGTALRLWSEDAFNGVLRSVDDLSSEKVDLRFVNPQTGPFHVEGAEPGDTLEVRILSIDLAIPYGYNGCAGYLPDNCPTPRGPARIIPLDTATMTATFAPGIVIPLRPFFGSMGVAPPPEAGRISSNPPWIHAGNLDNKALVAGTTLLIPVHAAGALFEVGDGHAAQGDGEVDQTAIETSLRGRLQLTVRKGMKLAWPRAETPTDYITMGTDEDLAKATKTAIQEMIDFLMTEKKLDRLSAYQLTSIAGNVAITQLVDGKVGVHVKMPKEIFK